MQTGSYSTTNQESLRKRSVKLADRVWYKNGASPLISMLKGKGKVDTTENQKCEWVSDIKATFSLEANAFTAAATSITVASGASVLKEGDIINVPSTGEQMRVSSVTSDTAFVVTRGYGVTPATAVTEKTTIQMLSTAYAEGTNAPDGVIINKKEDYNFTQIFKHKIQFTRNELKSPRYGSEGDKRKERRAKTLELHKRLIERQLLFGERNKSADKDGNALYTAGGVISFIKTNRIKLEGTFNLDSLNSVMGSVANADASGDKVLFCGSNIMNNISSEVLTLLRTGEVANKYGVDITEIVTAYGKVQVVFHPVISQANPNMALLLDMENIKYTTIDDTSITQDVHDKDFDGVMDMLLTDCTIQVYNEETHALIEI